ncbi:hypothetical protein [Brevibacillus dissolubilis]|uniref:hypothetical protein n=1 Tax=Brevibacillus dissolubilis TaxID=1844116 RepID=UPI0011163BE8|nr:hypothetical protein [Brevibacillus dissolubilis]
MYKRGVPVVLVLVIIATGFLCFNQYEQQAKQQMRLEMIAGHNLFLLTQVYEDIMNQTDNDSVGSEHIHRVKESMVKMKEYSYNVDSAVGQDHLQTLAEELEKVNLLLENRYTAKKQLTQQDAQTYKELLQLVKELRTTVYQHYYDQDDPEGGKATLTVTGGDEISRLIQKAKNLQKGAIR